MFWRIRLLFQGILVQNYNSLWRHIRILVHSSLLRSNLRITTLICRVFSSFGLVHHPRSSRWLVTPLLLMVTNLAIGHLRCLTRLHTLISWYNIMEIHHVMFHVCLCLRLIYNTRIVLGLFRDISVSNTQIPHIFGRTCLKAFDSALQWFAPLLNSGLAIRLHQWR